VPDVQLTTTIAAPLDDCFMLALSVDAHARSMGSSGERAVSGVRSGAMELGQTVTWQARHFGLPFRMTSKITVYERPSLFVDEQVRGPFAAWWHEHRFEEKAGKTVMTDVVHYRSPAGSLGRLVERAFLERYMQRLLQQRNAWLEAELDVK
jgi:ligand-binding SRPBCC domain-containing protein